MPNASNNRYGDLSREITAHYAGAFAELLRGRIGDFKRFDCRRDSRRHIIVGVFFHKA